MNHSKFDTHYPGQIKEVSGLKASLKSANEKIEQQQGCISNLVNVCKGTNQCFECKYGYRSNISNGCPEEADGELPCAGFIKKFNQLLTLTNAIARAEEHPKDEPELSETHVIEGMQANAEVEKDEA